MRLDSNIESKSLNNNYLNIIELLFLIFFFQFQDHRIGKFSNNIDFRKLDFFRVYNAMWLNWLKDRLKMLGEESFAQREREKIVAHPQTNATSISCVRFLTNYDVGERKQHILVTISCERKQIFQAAISKHETTSILNTQKLKIKTKAKASKLLKVKSLSLLKPFYKPRLRPYSHHKFSLIPSLFSL